MVIILWLHPVFLRRIAREVSVRFVASIDPSLAVPLTLFTSIDSIFLSPILRECENVPVYSVGREPMPGFFHRHKFNMYRVRVYFRRKNHQNE